MIDYAVCYNFILLNINSVYGKEVEIFFVHIIYPYFYIKYVFIYKL